MKTVTLCAIALSLFANPVAAQEPTEQEIDAYIELVRIDVRQVRSEWVGEAMELSASQAAQFWPVYEEYEQAYTALGDTKLQLIGDYAVAYDSMTDETATTLVGQMFDLVADEQALLREYHGKLQADLGGAVAARFVQVERRIGLLLDLRLAADIPLLEAPR